MPPANTTRKRWWSPGVTNRRMKLVMSYAPDWIVSTAVAVLFFVVGNMSGFRREFSLTDTTIQHTFAVKERIPNSALVLIAGVAPLVLMPVVNLLSVRSFWDLHNSWLGLLTSISFAGTATNIVKITVGRPRPDLIDRCQPIPGSVNHPVFGLVTSSICTQTDQAIMDDGWKSFFSGHSSLSFAGLGFLAFYLSGKLHLFDERGHTPKAWLAATPIAGASLVAISRTMDNRHHWQDVLVGSMVGLGFAYFAYRQYYPPLNHVNSQLPYGPRVDSSRSLLPHHADDIDPLVRNHLLPGRQESYRSDLGLQPLHDGAYRDSSDEADENRDSDIAVAAETDRTVGRQQGEDNRTLR